MSSASLLDENGDYSVGTNDGNLLLLCVFFSINCGFFLFAQEIATVVSTLYLHVLVLLTRKHELHHTTNR